jgi:hypothetical protein
VEVTQEVRVVIDDEKINNEFNEAFSAMMWDVDCPEDHAKHLAQMKARGMIGMDNFVEGYGKLEDMNIEVSANHCNEEII